MLNEAYRRWAASIPIHGLVGANGFGKTLSMVWLTMPELDAGRHVLSTVRLTDFRNPRSCEGVRFTSEGREIPCDIIADDHSDHLVAHPCYEPLHSFVQLVEVAANSTILCDEISNSFSARSSMALPAPMLRAIKQLRKGDSIFRYTCPSYADADVALRRVSQGVTMCTGFVGKDVPGRLWRANRVFRQLTYKAEDLDDIDQADRAKDKEAKRVRAQKWSVMVGSRCGAFDAYDTYWTAGTLGWVDESGKCIRCGGSRPARKCSCDTDHD